MYSDSETTIAVFHHDSPWFSIIFPIEKNTFLAPLLRAARWACLEDNRPTPPCSRGSEGRADPMLALCGSFFSCPKSLGSKHLPSGYVKIAMEHGPFILDLPVKNGDFPVRYVSHYQRLTVRGSQPVSFTNDWDLWWLGDPKFYETPMKSKFWGSLTVFKRASQIDHHFLREIHKAWTITEGWRASQIAIEWDFDETKPWSLLVYGVLRDCQECGDTIEKPCPLGFLGMLLVSF